MLPALLLFGPLGDVPSSRRVDQFLLQRVGYSEKVVTGVLVQLLGPPDLIQVDTATGLPEVVGDRVGDHRALVGATECFHDVPVGLFEEDRFCDETLEDPPVLLRPEIFGVLQTQEILGEVLLAAPGDEVGHEIAGVLVDRQIVLTELLFRGVLSDPLPLVGGGSLSPLFDVVGTAGPFEVPPCGAATRFHRRPLGI